jgi:hypothetical protein
MSEDFALYRHLAARYSDVRVTPRQACPHCHDVLRARHEHRPPHAGPDFHRHGRRHVQTVIRPLTIVSNAIDEKLVERAVDWITDHWQGDHLCRRTYSPSSTARTRGSQP